MGAREEELRGFVNLRLAYQECLNRPIRGGAWFGRDKLAGRWLSCDGGGAACEGQDIDLVRFLEGFGFGSRFETMRLHTVSGGAGAIGWGAEAERGGDFFHQMRIPW